MILPPLFDIFDVFAVGLGKVMSALCVFDKVEVVGGGGMEGGTNSRGGYGGDRVGREAFVFVGIKGCGVLFDTLSGDFGV